MNKEFYVVFWIRTLNKDKKIKNIVRVLSPQLYNPFKIPHLPKIINEKEGTLEFVISTGNMFDKNLNHIVIFDLPIGSSRFILQRENFYNLVFYRISPNYGFRVTRLNISRMKNSKGLHIFVTWSQQEDKLYVGDIEQKIGLLSAKSNTVPTKVIKGKNGSLILVGDEGIDIKLLYIKKGKEIITEPSAKEVFDFNMERLKILIKGCKGDFLFETTCVQAGLVLLVSAIEAYFKKRFIELEKEGWKPNLEALLKKLFSSKYIETRRKEIEEKASSEHKSIIETLAEHYINFQNINKCKKAYNSCYGLKFGEIFKEEPHLIEKVKQIITYRHKIVHSGKDTTILNYEEIPNKQPIFSDKQLLEKALQNIIKFINKFHKATLSYKKPNKK